MKNFTQYSIDFKEYKKYVGLPFFEILNKLLIKKEDLKNQINIREIHSHTKKM